MTYFSVIYGIVKAAAQMSSERTKGTPTDITEVCGLDFMGGTRLPSEYHTPVFTGTLMLVIYQKYSPERCVYLTLIIVNSSWGTHGLWFSLPRARCSRAKEHEEAR